MAVKLFGQGVTTDGSAQNDSTASLLAGDHPSIIRALGGLINALDGGQGLVMELVSKDYKVLGVPPDFTNFTRDSYAHNILYKTNGESSA